MRCEAPRADCGFTLSEMLVVLGILAMAGLFAMPLVNRPIGDAVLTATARKLANEMRIARAAAIAGNTERTLTIDLARRRFWVDGVTGATAIADGIAVDFITIHREQISARQGRLRFFTDGSATGGNVILRTGRRAIAIELDWMTGHASLGRSR